MQILDILVLDGERSKSKGYENQFLPFLSEKWMEMVQYTIKRAINAQRPLVIHDFRETLSDLLYTEFASPWTEWCKKSGTITRYQAHGSPGNLLDLYALSDIPETGTWLADHFKESLSKIKPQVDELFVSGINHVFYQGTTYSPKNENFPGWLFFASTNFGPSAHFWDELPLLKSWTEWGDDSLRSFCGKARYVSNFRIKNYDKSESYQLVFNNIRETAKVYINGISCGTIWALPYCLEIPANILRKNNTIEIIVQNLSANLIKKIDSQQIQWKKFYDINFVVTN